MVLLSLTALCATAQVQPVMNNTIFGVPITDPMQQQIDLFNGFMKGMENMQFNFNMPPTNVPIETPTYNNNSNTNSSSNQTSSGLANKQMDEKTYQGYADLLMNMRHGITTYDNNSRLRYQQTMRDIRMRWINKGYPFYQSPMETWDGSR